MAFFFINKSLWKRVFYSDSYILTDRLNKVRTKLNNFISVFWGDIKFKTQNRKQLKTKEIETWKTKTQKDKYLDLRKE